MIHNIQIHIVQKSILETSSSIQPLSEWSGVLRNGNEFGKQLSADDLVPLNLPKNPNGHHQVCHIWTILTHRTLQHETYDVLF